MTIELPAQLESALKAQAAARGLSVDVFVRRVVERQLAADEREPSDGAPFKTDRGVLAGYGPAPSAEEIDSNRAEIFGRFGESLQ
ncbi:MAG TPA: hypothetical protein VG267_11085 [Terracidiphilus sp.]|jgi:plasmid stability protein|nr:hypothetical protein [Terracidiphilus sp.]